MNFSYSLVTLFLICSLMSCQNNDLLNARKYEGCCGVAPQLLDFSPGNVYMPNIFTPNLDGINDVYFVHSDDGIEEVEEFIITSNSGRVVFEQYNILPNEQSRGWLPQEEEKNGLFEYQVRVRTINQEVFEFGGFVCSYTCEDSHIFELVENCGFSRQHDGLGGLASVVPTGEDCE